MTNLCSLGTLCWIKHLEHQTYPNGQTKKWLNRLFSSYGICSNIEQGTFYSAGYVNRHSGQEHRMCTSISPSPAPSLCRKNQPALPRVTRSKHEVSMSRTYILIQPRYESSLSMLTGQKDSQALEQATLYIYPHQPSCFSSRFTVIAAAAGPRAGPTSDAPASES
jgi:hypothetical protein